MIKLFSLKINIRQSGVNQALYVKNSDDKVEIFELNMKGRRNKILETRNSVRSGITTWFKQNKKRISVISISSFSIALIGFCILFGTMSFENRLYNQYYESFDKNAKGFYLSDGILEEAKKQYKDGDYKAALAIFSSVPDNINLDVEIRLYSGLTLMEMDRHNEAITCFEYVISSSKEAGHHALWYLALCHLKQNNLAEACSIFSKISDNKLFNHKKAKRLFKKISGKI